MARRYKYSPVSRYNPKEHTTSDYMPSDEEVLVRTIQASSNYLGWKPIDLSNNTPLSEDQLLYGRATCRMRAFRGLTLDPYRNYPNYFFNNVSYKKGEAVKLCKTYGVERTPLFKPLYRLNIVLAHYASDEWAMTAFDRSVEAVDNIMKDIIPSNRLFESHARDYVIHARKAEIAQGLCIYQTLIEQHEYQARKQRNLSPKSSPH